MTRSTTALLVTLAFAQILLVSSSIYTIEATSLALDSTASFYYEGNYYMRNTIVNLDENILIQNTPCSSQIIMTPDEKFYCENVSSIDVSMIEITPDGSQVLGKYLMPRSYFQSGFNPSGDFITLAVSNNTPVYYAFDPSSNEYVCKTPAIDQTSLSDAWYTGEAMIYMTNAYNQLVFSPCGQANITTNYTKGYVPSQIFGFNQSSVFVYDYNINFKENQMAAYLDLTGTFHFGPQYNLSELTKFNDTHLVGAQYVNNYVVNFLLYTISPTLEFQLVANFTPGLINAVLIAAIAGTSQISVDFPSGNFIYDFDTNEIVIASSSTPPLTFSNGAVINLTMYGYFIQNSGENIKYVPYGRQVSYFQDGDTYWGLSLVSGQSNGYLYSFNLTESTTSDTVFPNCPTNISSPNFQGVYFYNGNQYISVVDFTNDVAYLISISGFRTISTFKNNFGYDPSITYNIPNNTGTYIAEPGQFVIKNFYLNNGSVYASRVIATPTAINWAVISINDQYVLAQIDNSTTQSTFIVIDITTLQYIKEFVITFPGLQSGGYSKTCITIGADNNPNFYDWLVCYYQYNVYFINTYDVLVAHTNYNGFLPLTLTPVDENSFYIYQSGSYFNNITLIELDN